MKLTYCYCFGVSEQRQRKENSYKELMMNNIQNTVHHLNSNCMFFLMYSKYATAVSYMNLLFIM